MKKLGWLKVYGLSVLLTSLAELVSAVPHHLSGHEIWDYSGLRFNLWGMVCLENSLLFGLGALAFLYGVLPLIDKLERKLSPAFLDACFFVLVVIYPFFAVHKVMIMFR